MKHSIIILLFLCLGFKAFGQQPEYPDSGFTNKAEAKNLMVKGQKEGKWVEYLDINTNITNDSTDNSWCRLTVYKKGRPYGIVRLYMQSTGNLFCETPYKNGEKEGTEKFYDYLEGPRRLVAENPYSNGKKNGVQKEYSPDGKVMVETPFTNGIKNGIEKLYNTNGGLEFETPYKDGKIDGVQKEYNKSGELFRETIYVNDIKVETKYFDEDGNEIK